MADNVGPYLSYGDLLLELYLGDSRKVSSSTLILSNKVNDPLGDLFDFSVTGSDPLPQVGDVIAQAGNTECIIQILSGPDRVRVQNEISQIVDGSSLFLHSDKVPKTRGEQLIKLAMAEVDRDTRQFFNKRTGIYQVEGNNSPLLHFNVPIIEITRLVINNTDLELTEGDDFDFVAFKGRELPTDDRQNPKIKLNVRNDNIFSGVMTNKVFRKDTRTTIEGSFGYLEPDGSTPLEIQKGVKRLVIREIEEPQAVSAATATKGGLRRIKVDLHEKEFFELRGVNRSFNKDDQVYSQIVAKFRSPIIVTGSFREIRADDLL